MHNALHLSLGPYHFSKRIVIFKSSQSPQATEIISAAIQNWVNKEIWSYITALDPCHCSVGFDPTICWKIGITLFEACTFCFLAWKFYFSLLSLRMAETKSPNPFFFAAILKQNWWQEEISGWLKYQFEYHSISVW